MASICFYFQVHQPFRVKDYRVFDIGNDSEYFNDDSDRSINNKKILNKVAGKCYLPANAVMLELLKKGLDKDTAYRKVQSHAMAAWKGTGKFLSLLADDPEVRRYLTYEEISGCFDNGYYLKNIDEIYRRVFGR